MKPRYLYSGSFIAALLLQKLKSRCWRSGSRNYVNCRRVAQSATQTPPQRRRPYHMGQKIWA